MIRNDEYIFTPTIDLGLSIGRATLDEIINEPMLFSASPRFAWERGGQLTARVLDALDGDSRASEIIAEAMDVGGKFPTIDTRVHMLMPGQYPAIPGWHCDSYPRSGYHDQPDVSHDDKYCTHFVVCLDHGTGALMRIATETLVCKVDTSAVWESVDRQCANLGHTVVPSGRVVHFTQQTLHCATPATGRGWRFFFRLSMYHAPPLNRVRNQVQVYTTAGGGW